MKPCVYVQKVVTKELFKISHCRVMVIIRFSFAPCANLYFTSLPRGSTYEKHIILKFLFEMLKKFTE